MNLWKSIVRLSSKYSKSLFMWTQFISLIHSLHQTLISAKAKFHLYELCLFESNFSQCPIKWTLNNKLSLNPLVWTWTPLIFQFQLYKLFVPRQIRIAEFYCASEIFTRYRIEIRKWKITATLNGWEMIAQKIDLKKYELCRCDFTRNEYKTHLKRERVSWRKLCFTCGIQCNVLECTAFVVVENTILSPKSIYCCRFHWICRFELVYIVYTHTCTHAALVIEWFCTKN